MNETPRKTTVTLEDLLRIKRAERPPAEFWEQFEHGMHTKQLAAIVEPRPWWAPFIRVGTKVVRYQLPVGAAAILAVTFITMREYRTVNIAPAYEPAVAAVVDDASGHASFTPSSATNPEGSLAVAAVDSGIDDISAANDIYADPKLDAAMQATTAVGAISHVVPVASELTPSARYIRDNLAMAEAADPELDQMLGRSMRNVESRPVKEPLSQVSVPGESRRERIMAGYAWMASAKSGESAIRPDDSSRRLTERRMSESDTVSRMAASGSTFMLKF